MKTQTLVAIAVVLATVRFVQAQDLGRSTSSTPYDGYLAPMRATMSALGGNRPEMPLVKDYVRTGRSFRYYMNHPYIPQTPAVTEATRAGDCKAKSLWVAYKMDDRTLRYVIGRARKTSGMSHAWLLWRGPNGWLILDATNYSSPIEVSRLGPNEFIALYSYSSGGKYVHAGAAAPKAKAEAKYGDHV
jgi:hypothetical protein